MAALRRPMRAGFAILLAALVVAIALGAGAAMTARPGDRALHTPGPCAPSVTVFLTRNSYHAELALPSGWLRSQGGAAASALDRIAPAPWVSIGWGDDRFFRGAGWSADRVLDALRALGPDNPSVIRLTPLDRRPDLMFSSGVLRVELSQAGAERLVRRLDRSFRTAGGRLVQEPSLQAGDTSAYFASVDRFSITEMCNEWVGRLLDAAGLRTTPVLDVAPQGLMWQTRRRTAELQSCAQAADRRWFTP